MPVIVSVSDVRAAWIQAGARSGNSTERTAFTAQLGTWFHQIVAELTSSETRTAVADLLADCEPELACWKKQLAHFTYERCVKPRLLAEFAALHHVAGEVLAFWKATQSVCDWLADLSWAIHQDQEQDRADGSAAWLSLTGWFSSEEELEVELREPHWTDSVRLIGKADAVLRPNSGRWCAIEFKLGESAPVADLGQACLYHLMLSASAENATSHQAHGKLTDVLALVRFTPERHELLFDSQRLAQAKPSLLEHIGRLAGVVPDASRPTATTTSTAPKSAAKAATSPTTNASVQVVTAEHRELGSRIIKACAEFDIAATLAGDPIVGPTFLRFPLTLGRRQKVAPVKKLPEDLQVKLKLIAAPFVTLERGQLVVDVQRPDRQVVNFAEVRSQLPVAQPGVRQARVPVGVDLDGRLQCLDFSNPEHAHVLVAGTTGSGKSEWLRTAIAGLIVSNTPETLRLLLIDPKRNAFHALRQSPFLWKPIVFPDEQSSAAVLEALADEMDRRYRLLNGADSLAQLTPQPGDPLPRIVCVIDEYFDLINRNKTERKAIEEQVFRLGAKARAASIHLIIATQQPSRDTIKGALDANMPARVGLKMEKNTESRMLFGESGAERLLGHGDLLFKDLGPPKRLQAPLLTSLERDTIFAGRYSPRG